MTSTILDAERAACRLVVAQPDLCRGDGGWGVLDHLRPFYRAHPLDRCEAQMGFGSDDLDQFSHVKFENHVHGQFGKAKEDTYAKKIDHTVVTVLYSRNPARVAQQVLSLRDGYH